MKKRFLAGIVCVAMLFGAAGCQKKEEKKESTDLMSGVWQSSEEADSSLLESTKRPLTDFGIRLLQTEVKNAETEENILLSPVSVMLALYMTSNGASGKTKEQMEQVLGKDLNEYLYAYQTVLEGKEEGKLHIANGIWYKEKDSLVVKESFLQKNKNYFNATVCKAPFHETTRKEINDWVSRNTNGMIDSILDEMDPNAVMYLLNAVSFEAEWDKIYDENSIRDNRSFIKEDGTEQKVTMMYSKESLYLEDEKATGFMKYYKGRNYAFVALLPKEGTTVAEYVEGMDGTTFSELLANAVKGTVSVGIPKFKTEYESLLNDSLKEMGMTDAFSLTKADFSEMATDDGNLYIGRVLHKTSLVLDERGTKAGAATAVEMLPESAPIEIYEVYLNRPFVYLLIDCQTNQPVFLGTMMDME